MAKLIVIYNANEFYIYNKKSLISLLRTEIHNISLKKLEKYENLPIRQKFGLDGYTRIPVKSIRKAIKHFNEYKLKYNYGICRTN